MSKEKIDYYWAAAIQMMSKSGKPGDSVAKYKKAKEENVKTSIRMLDRACRTSPYTRYPRKVRLIVFPQANLTGYPPLPSPVDSSEWIERGCVYLPGEETEKMAEKTAEYDVYVMGHGYERDDDWPGAFFNTCFLMNPEGKLLSKYRRLHTDVAVSPDEIFNDYIKKVGWEGFFPVVDTPLGKLATFSCSEINIAEISRVFGLKGAEVIGHCDSSATIDPTVTAASRPEMLAKTINRRARAIENACYIIRANNTLAGVSAEIIDYYGRILARTFDVGEQIVSTPLNMFSLRKRRAEGYSITRLRTHIFAHFYETITTWPPNQFLGKGIPHNLQLAKEEYKNKCYENCLKLGILRSEALE